MGMACSTHGEKMYAYRILVRKSEGVTPLGRPRRRWENNIRMVLRLVWTGYIWLRIGTGGGLS
jgi:hypothetical protein